MSVKKEVFGIHPSGKEVYKFEIVNKQGMKKKKYLEYIHRVKKFTSLKS